MGHVLGYFAGQTRDLSRIDQNSPGGAVSGDRLTAEAESGRARSVPVRKIGITVVDTARYY
jgi:hypothetical protein